MNKNCFVFIVGSPRSGTTVLGEILDKHRKISQWYEPYFIWDKHFRNAGDDCRSAVDATPIVKRHIQSSFLRYKTKTDSSIIVDKSPRNSLKMSFIREIFPEARFIHIIRDGRDATLSIHKEWLRRRQIVHGNDMHSRFNYMKALSVVRSWLSRQPFVQDRINAFWFETHGHFLDKSKHLNRLRWEGETGWGPRCEGWQQLYNSSSLLQFNAYQWLKCVDTIRQDWSNIPTPNKLEFRYEDLIQNGTQKIYEILDFIGVQPDKQFNDSLPVLKRNNFNKWKKEFSNQQLDEIQSILTPMLISLG